MTTNVEQELDGIRAKISQEQEARTRAQVRKEQAEARLSAAMEELATKFKVNSVEDAQALVAKLELNIRQQVEVAKVALRKESGE